ncbi:tryptophan-rich sensory protein [Polymorphobacter fuscus]|uniref:Tryptophan-rich sensory protein n=2 Tax=Sandarakinorhabdus fusca TaxID=1439888 RepID=A0A7C9GZ33_9SPHN|nr:TspO/MBR family protein [Polymorphobacter fuscus]KAB7644498.1 tryptophan-rich sensory protein [Polymorphobacter fuscus]MQT18314.1 tryptophan-rich sensory protein [Polymorphobacter fuscus]
MDDFNTPVAAAIAWAVGLCLIGGLMTPRAGWYESLNKPSWQPPGWLFGPAWTIILGLAAWSAVIAWNAAGTTADQRTVLIVFAVNGLFHLLWSPLFFKMQRPDWALVEVPFLWASLVAMTIGLWPISEMAALLILPYLAWVSFAAYLNLTIVRLNPRSRPQVA